MITGAMQITRMADDGLQREKAFFGFPPIDFTGVEKSLARSGESCVYKGQHDQLGEVAIKVGCRPLVETCVNAVRWYPGLPSQEALAAAQDDLREARNKRINRTLGRMAQLRDHFGDSVVPEELALQTVSMSGAFLEYCLRSHTIGAISVPYINPEDCYSLETIVRVQPFLPALHDPDRGILATRYAEIQWDNALGIISGEDYATATRTLISPEAEDFHAHDNDIDDLLRIQGSPLLSALVARVQTDPELRRSFGEFLRNLRSYVDATAGGIVDVIGKNNIIFDGHSRCVISDGLYADDGHVILEAREALERIIGGERPQRSQMNRLYNVLNFMRGMNIVALACGSPERFWLEPAGSSDIARALQETARLAGNQYGLNGKARVAGVT